MESSLSSSAPSVPMVPAAAGDGDQKIDDDEEEEMTTRTTSPTQNQNQTITFASRYPHIRDHDALQHTLFHYQFQGHDFVNLPWKALQILGWKYTNGVYRAPPALGLGNRAIFANPIDIQKFLDLPRVPVLTSSLQTDHDDDDDDDVAAVTTSLDDDWNKIAQRLREDVCYQMQLLIEQCSTDSISRSPTIPDNDKAEYETDSRIPTTAGTAVAEEDIDLLADEHHLSRRRGGSRRAAARSATATETGSDLYLHKASRGRRGSKKKKNDDDAAGDSSTLPFPTLSECTTFMDECSSNGSLDECQRIEAYYAKHRFAQYQFLLSTNHSLLLYGHGSHHELLTRLGDDELSKEGYVLHIQGFDPHVSVEGILDLLVDLFLQGKEPTVDENAQWQRSPPLKINDDAPALVVRAVAIARAVSRYCLEQTKLPIFLIIHSLDGIGMRTQVSQDTLAALISHAMVPNDHLTTNDNKVLSTATPIRLVASINHVDAAAALWTAATCNAFNWIWKEVHTYRPYQHEMVMLVDTQTDGTSAGGRRKKKAAAAVFEQHHATRVLTVLRNLAPRYTEALQALAKLQMIPKTSDINNNWVSYPEFWSECKSKFIIDKESKLRNLLTELKDHQLVVSKKEGPSEFVSIPYQKEKLQEIIEYKYDGGGR